NSRDRWAFPGWRSGGGSPRHCGRRAAAPGVACGLFFREQRPVVAERVEVEELEPGEDRRKGSLGHAQLIADVKEVVLDVPLAELIGRDQVVGGQLANGAEILASGPFNQPGELHVLDQTVFQFGHRDTLSCVGAKDLQPQRPEIPGYHTRLVRRSDPFHPAQPPSPLPPSRGEAASSNAGWRMADGRCRMADGKCRMADGKCRMAYGGGQMRGGKGHPRFPAARNGWSFPLLLPPLLPGGTPLAGSLFVVRSAT